MRALRKNLAVALIISMSCMSITSYAAIDTESADTVQEAQVEVTEDTELDDTLLEEDAVIIEDEVKADEVEAGAEVTEDIEESEEDTEEKEGLVAEENKEGYVAEDSNATKVVETTDQEEKETLLDKAADFLESIFNAPLKDKVITEGYDEATKSNVDVTSPDAVASEGVDGYDSAKTTETIASSSNATKEEEDETVVKVGTSTETIEDMILEATPSDAIKSYKVVETPTSTNTQIELGVNEIILPKPTRPGYHFVEWNTERDGSGDFWLAGEVIEIQNLDLYAIWEEGEYIDYEDDLTYLGYDPSEVVIEDASDELYIPDVEIDENGAYIVVEPDDYEETVSTVVTKEETTTTTETASNAETASETVGDTVEDALVEEVEDALVDEVETDIVEDEAEIIEETTESEKETYIVEDVENEIIEDDVGEVIEEPTEVGEESEEDNEVDELLLKKLLKTEDETTYSVEEIIDIE